MYRTVTEYKTYGDLLGAIKQALRRFTPSGTCLIQIENINSENHIVEQDLLITDGKTAIRITEIAENDLNKLKTMFNEIAIPYVYQNAYEYHYNLWLAQQKNKDVEVQLYAPKVVEVVIPRPERKVKKRPLFTFLDEEE